jgi:formylglycine-generating enzyme required for sulfatase activity
MRRPAGTAFCTAIITTLFAAAMSSAQAQPATFRDCDICPQMTALSGGALAMGSPEVKTTGLSEEALKYAGEFEEQPQHKVNIRAFALGTYEVTQAEWQAIMGDNPSSTLGDNLPVENVSWEEAQEFARRLSERTGKRYRLPTEAEWEYAARAGSAQTFPFGDDPAQLPAHAWFRANAEEHSHPVGSREPNAFGLHDMLGNVWERTDDCWRPHYEDAPDDGSARTDGDCDLRVVRGGSWVNLPQFLRPAARFRYSTRSRYEFVGLRIARDM